MKLFSKKNLIYQVSLAVFIAAVLTGCIGENYDFNPPALKISNSSNIMSEELAESSVDWRGEDNIQIEKDVTDKLALAKEQPQIQMAAGERVDMIFGHGDFERQELKLSLLKDNKEFELEVTDDSFVLPDQPGEYVLQVNLQTDRGKAQYAGNIIIK